MRIVTRQEVVDANVKDWLSPKYPLSALPAGHRFPGLGDQSREEISARLRELSGPPYDTRQVEEAFQCAGRTTNMCDECEGDFAAIMRFGSEPDYDVQWQDLCAGCLEKAVEELRRLNV